MVSRYFFLFFSFLALAACANTPSDNNPYIQQPRPYLPVEINILSDVRGTLPEFPVNSDASHYRAYLQASNNDRYRIRVGNNTNHRIGVVIAVDGRNIISGQLSYLHNTERMYILNPHSSEEYEGWRSSQNQVNRFYFTEAADSYAAAWGDTSAMGVIAVAVYAEIPPPEIYEPMTDMMRDRTAESKSAPKQAAPGTGYGEKRYSPSIAVNFQPQPEPMEKVFLKYEWRETLCKKGIRAACDAGISPKPDENRFWPDNDGFAPPPPRRRY